MIVPPAHIHVDAMDGDAVLARVAHQLRGRVKAHRLGIEQGAGEHGGLMAFDPGRNIDEPREGERMAFGEAIAAEPFDLAVAAFGEIALVAAPHHAADHLFPELVHAADMAEGRHRPAQLVRLRRGEFGRDDRQLHRLFLEQRHAIGLFQQIAQFIGIVRRIGRGKFGFFQPRAATQIGVDHVAFDRAGPHDRDLDRKVVKLARAQTRQHVDLGAAFHLEHADAVAPAQHVVNGRIIGIKVHHQLMIAQPMVAHQVECLADAGKHAERQHIDLHQAERVNVILVPFDEAAVGHGGMMERHGFIEPVLGEDEAADMLRQMAGKGRFKQLPHQFAQAHDLRVGKVETGFADPLFVHVARIAAPDGAGEAGDDIVGQAQHLGHFADRAARTIMDDGRGDAGAMAAIAVVDILHHLLAPLMFEIDVDVGRFVPFFRHEAGKEQVMFLRVDGGDAEQEADHRIGGRPAPLAQDTLRPGEGDDVVDG